MLARMHETEVDALAAEPERIESPDVVSGCKACCAVALCDSELVKVATGAKMQQLDIWKDLRAVQRAIPGARASREAAGKSLEVICSSWRHGSDARSNARVALRDVCICMLLKCKLCMHKEKLVCMRDNALFSYNCSGAACSFDRFSDSSPYTQNCILIGDHVNFKLASPSVPPERWDWGQEGSTRDRSGTNLTNTATTR